MLIHFVDPSLVYFYDIAHRGNLVSVIYPCDLVHQGNSESTKLLLFLTLALKVKVIILAIFSYNTEFYTKGDTHCIGYFNTLNFCTKVDT